MATMKIPTSSFSPFTHGWTYDVFISFRGKDTRLGFTGHLYDALRRKGISTFIDDRQIEKGEEITPALFKAIQESRIALVVFSKHYAESTFCLEELAKIMECSNDKGMLVWPVFYHVDPADVRYQKGRYAEALAKHEAKMIEKGKIEMWRVALKKAADLSGLHFKRDTDRYEYKFIEEIIQEVSKKINGIPLEVANYPVGLESRVQKINSLLDVESSNGVHMVGIYGIRGIGKTTLARAVYNSIAYQFESLYFLDDIAENSRKHGLVSLQEMLICKSVGMKDIKLLNLNKAIQIIKSRLSRKKVLLVLDNVDKLEQIKALAGGLDWFGLGSKIIITTRHEHLLHDFGVQKTYEVEPLNHEDALELFSWNAFKRKEVISSYEDISKRVIHYSNYLPLSLEMIGLGFRVGMLSNEKISSDFDRTLLLDCNSSLDAYERIRHESIQEILYVRDSDKDNINCNVDEKDNAQHLRVGLKKEQEEKEKIRKKKAEAPLDTIIHDNYNDKINFNVDDKDIALHHTVRLKKEQEKKEQIRKEKAKAHLDTTVIHDNNKDNIYCDVDNKDIAQHYRVRLKKEQEEKKQIRKEKAEAHLDAIIHDSNKDKINCNVDDKDIAQLRRVMCSDYIDKKKELLEAILKGRQLSNLPKITQVDSSHAGAELRVLEVFYHNMHKVVIHTINLPKQSAVEDVINSLKSKVELSHPGAELRLLKVFNHKIHKIFSPSEKIENINDQYWTLRAEEIPEEEKNICSHDQLIHVYHYMKVTAQNQNQEQIQNFGDPFFLVIHKHERLANIKLRIQKKLRVPDAEFSKWMFAFVFFGCPEYLKDSDIVSTRFKGCAWKHCYLGLEHADNAPKRSYAANQCDNAEQQKARSSSPLSFVHSSVSLRSSLPPLYLLCILTVFVTFFISITYYNL